MLARSRLIRVTAAVVPALLGLSVLSACGSTKTGYGDPTTAGFGAVSVSGSFGKTPALTWEADPAYPTTTQVKTLTKGTGAAVGTASVDLHVYIADAARDMTRATTSCAAASASASASASPSASATPSASSSASSSAMPSPVTVPTCPPVSWPLKGSWAYQTAKGKYDTLQPQAGTVWSTILSGAHVGSRIEALAGSDTVFPAQTAGAAAGAPTIGVGSHDAVLVVVDVMRKTPVSPTPKDAKVHTARPGSMPKVLQSGGKPSGFDWAGVSKPSLTTPVQREVLKQGTGAVVTSTDTVTVNYMGETYKATKPFDSSYSRGKPLTDALSSLVKGWAIGLTGVKVGSRVLLQIPPYYGYGATKKGTIPGNSTMWFVVDVIKVTKGS